MRHRATQFLFLAGVMLALSLPLRADDPRTGLAVHNGWYTHDGQVVWGLAQHNGWWRDGQRPNITRNAPGDVRPNRTEDLVRLTDAMLQFGYPGFEHNFGLWYDRRRDAHDQARRADAMVRSPFLEQPWARSGKGKAWMYSDTTQTSSSFAAKSTRVRSSSCGSGLIRCLRGKMKRNAMCMLA
jgi:Family of unknown function (DUF6298)